MRDRCEPINMTGPNHDLGLGICWVRPVIYVIAFCQCPRTQYKKCLPSCKGKARVIVNSDSTVSFTEFSEVTTRSSLTYAKFLK